VSGVATLLSVGLVIYLVTKKKHDTISKNVRHLGSVSMHYGEQPRGELLDYLEKSFNCTFRVFNASLTPVNGEYYVFGRVSNANHDNLTWQYAFSFTLWCKFDIENMKMIGDWKVLETVSGPVKYPYEPCMVQGGEDARTFTFRKKLYLIYNTQTKSNSCKNQMYYSPIEIIDGTPYLVNSEAIMLYCDELETTNSIQKNWGAWVYNDELYFIHSVNNEHVILRCEDIKTGKCRIYSRSKTNVKGLRKPLVLAENNTEVLVLTHRTKQLYSYTNVFYTFSKTYPHEVLRVSEEFQFNKRKNNRDDFEYIMQGFIQNDKLYFSGGVNDDVPFFSEVAISDLFNNINKDKANEPFINREECNTFEGFFSKHTCDKIKK
jgi:predicted GH43/DUF377 family glycosyl hydrolase